MSGKRIGLLGVAVVTLILTSASIFFPSSGFYELLDGSSPVQLFLPLIAFFVWFAAFAVIIKMIIDALPAEAVGIETKTTWERTRRSGRLSYVLNALLFFAVPTMVVLAIEFTRHDDKPENFRNLIALLITTVGMTIFVALRMWKYNEDLNSGQS